MKYSSAILLSKITILKYMFVTKIQSSFLFINLIWYILQFIAAISYCGGACEYVDNAECRTDTSNTGLDFCDCKTGFVWDDYVYCLGKAISQIIFSKFKINVLFDDITDDTFLKYTI